MSHEHDVDPLGDQLIDLAQEADEVLLEDRVAFAITEILDRFLAGLAEDVLDERFLEPVGRVDDDGLEALVVRDELFECVLDGAPIQRQHASGLDLARTVLSVDNERVGDLRGQRALADALGPVYDGADGALFFSSAYV